MPNPTLNRRYQRLIDQLDRVNQPTRETFLYLFAMVAVQQGIISVVKTQEEKGRRVVVMNDPAKKQEFKVVFPADLDPDYAPTAVAEMERLLSDDSVGTSMDEGLFKRLYQAFSCANCRYIGPRYWQFCAECQFAGHPINYEKQGRR
ncbi:MAG TPA: hypothetical protein VFD42_04390 [Chloroflexota bacterium]|nr:hypothetical protein [Chloroflexota bacterium]